MKNKKAFITGGTRGIGAAICRQYESAGYTVISPSRSELELSSSDSVTKYLSRQASWDIDVLINNAGENKVNPIERLALVDWERMMSTNLTSAVLLIQAFSHHMVSKGWGRIVNISSVYSARARAGRVAYSATKAGLDAVTRTAATELGAAGILVTSVCPGFVDTEMTSKNNSPETIAELCKLTALKRLAAPEEIAKVVFFLGSEANSYITGQSLVVDGGFSCQ